MTRYLLLTSAAASWALLALSGVVFERGTFAWESSDSARGAALVETLESRPSKQPSFNEVESRQPGDAVATAATTTASSKATPVDAVVPPPATPQPAPKTIEPTPAAVVPVAPKNVIEGAANRPDTKHKPAHPGVATR